MHNLRSGATAITLVLDQALENQQLFAGTSSLQVAQCGPEHSVSFARFQESKLHHFCLFSPFACAALLMLMPATTIKLLRSKEQ
jgi:hypothetical protein